MKQAIYNWAHSVALFFALLQESINSFFNEAKSEYYSDYKDPNKNFRPHKVPRLGR